MKESYQYYILISFKQWGSFTWLYREIGGPCASCVAGSVHCASQGAEFLQFLFPNHMGRWSWWPIKFSAYLMFNNMLTYHLAVKEGRRDTMDFARFQQWWLIWLMRVCELVGWAPGSPLWKGKLKLGLGKELCAVSPQQSQWPESHMKSWSAKWSAVSVAG